MKMRRNFLVSCLLVLHMWTREIESNDDLDLQKRIRALSPVQGNSDIGLRSDFVPIEYEPWNPDAGNRTSPYQGKTFKVAVYHQPPMVVISNWAAEGDFDDPGNLNGTRTFRDGMDGITIQFLDDLANEFNCIFRYYYPCPNYDDNKRCKFSDVTNKERAMAMLTEEFCSQPGEVTGLCFAAGPIKLTGNLAHKYDFTHPYFESSFKLVTMSGSPPFQFMSWASPFDYTLWIALVIEILVIGAMFMFTEGYGTNDEHITGVHGLGREPLTNGAIYFESCHWALLILVTGSDKTPTTHGGRTIVMAQLFFYLIILSIYTGSLINFLIAEPDATPITEFEDLYDRLSPNFRASNTICVGANQPSMLAWLNLSAILFDAKFNIVKARDLSDCLDMVYRRNVTATFFDEPIINDRILRDYMQLGKCGDGGICSDPSVNYDSCLCPVTMNKVCQNPMNNTRISNAGTLTPVGDTFNPFGYSLIFNSEFGRTDYITFNMAISDIKDSYQMITLTNMTSSIDLAQSCSNDGSGGAVVLEVRHIFGILVMTGIFFFLGVLFGIIENSIGFFINICPCCPNVDDDDIFEVAEVEDEDDDRKEEAGPAPPLLDNLESDMTVCESLLELQTRFDRIEELLQTAIMKSPKLDFQ